MPFIIILFLIPATFITIQFFRFLITGKRYTPILYRVMEFASFIVMPVLYLNIEGLKNDCCFDTTPFSPDHQLTIWVIIILCEAAYFYSSLRKKMAAPLIEVLVNCLLLLSIVLDIFIAIQTNEIFFALIGNLPIFCLSVLVLAKNQQLFIETSLEQEPALQNRLEKFCWRILALDPLTKYPVIFLFCLPVLVLITAILLLFGQKADSLIRAFTDTYHHGFSQWNYKCENVSCGGHYLCSVAANGHAAIVKPTRRGKRNGHDIICNRQLLISNAFEDLIQERLPGLHRLIRKQYNKVGNIVHRYYGLFSNKFFADCIYILMKPAEWLFLVVLYSADRNPENRIAKQYLHRDDRQSIDKLTPRL